MVDESGNGILQFPGSSVRTTGVLAPDPGPGGLSSALTYNLLGPPSLVSGDLILNEVMNGLMSDTVRFNPAGTGSPAYPAILVFYSDIDADSAFQLADTGFPTSLYTNTVTVTETTLPGGGRYGFLYTPSSGQPGFISGFSVSYEIVSDTPEPASLALMLIGCVLFGAGYWRSYRSTAVSQA